MRRKILIIFILTLIFFIGINGVCAETYNNYDGTVVSCGGGFMDNIPHSIPKIVSIIYLFIQIAVPVVLVIFGTLDLFKGITAQKEEEIKKGQQIFIKRLISGALVFFVFAIVKVVISFAADSTSNKIISCTECFIDNKCDKGFDKVNGLTDTIKDSASELKDKINNIGDKVVE